MQSKYLLSIVVSILLYSSVTVGEVAPIGSSANPLKMLIDREQAIQYIKPLFDAITKEFDIYFKVNSNKSYGAVINDFCTQKIHFAIFGTSSYGEIKKRCYDFAEIFAVVIEKGSSTSYSGIFVRKGHNLNTLKDLVGQSIAFGNQYSTSSFNFPVSMLIEAGINPADDFDDIFITGNHFAAIKALKTGKAIAAAVSFRAWLKAVRDGSIDPLYFKPLVKSIPIPNAPFVINKTLPTELKNTLRDAFRVIHTKLSSDKLLNSFGKQVDRYDVNVDEQLYLNTLKKLKVVTPKIKKSILTKANQH
ncbi:phosphate/phosphite/phosphonate ABC transporter substrate-binding protein [Candidatus Halobeggiatoa sp. HSG11]|nr:phosphate/phosphite/phosphonate ABC transporter substrate-binding protein [Candidatus Halobeggiatoa sp. HSG11]